MDVHVSNHADKSPAPASNRAFGLVFGAFWAVVGLAPLFRHHPLRRWALILSLGFVATALVAPKALEWPNRIWTRFGAAVHAVTSPIALFAAYVVGVLPTAFVLRLLGKDLLKRRFDRSAASYWIPRSPRSPTGAGMKNQF